MILDSYYKKTVSLRCYTKKQKLFFDIPQTGFSSHAIDQGTIALLAKIRENEKTKWKRILDLGCGYGPIALYLASDGFTEYADAVDRDVLAVSYTQRNAKKNNLEKISSFGSLGYENITYNKYDAIISNIPAKVGAKVHQQMLYQAKDFLRDGGSVWIVIVEPLEDEFDKMLSLENINIRNKWSIRDHVIYNYSFISAPEYPQNPYERGDFKYIQNNKNLTIETYYGLPEFDSISWSTEMLIDACKAISIEGSLKDIICWDSGQGHLPVILSALYKSCDVIHLYARDMLSIKASTKNLRNNGYGGKIDAQHTLDFSSIEGDPNLLVGRLYEKEGLEVHVERLIAIMTQYPKMSVILVCKANFGQRLIKKLLSRKIKLTLKKKQGLSLLYNLFGQ